ncbi:MAG: nitroreductase family protein [Pseudomonadota bacterium]
MEDAGDLDLSTVDALLGTTRSVRRKLDFERPVETERLLECINLATQAPTGLSEHWRFVVVTAPPKKAALAELYREALLEYQRTRGLALKPTQLALVDNLPRMPALIFVCCTQQPPDADPAAQIGYYGSLLPAAWSLMLALRSRGLGTTWTSLLAARQAAVGELLGFPTEVLHTAMFPVAYMKGATLKRAVRQKAQDITYFNQWGTPPAENTP